MENRKHIIWTNDINLDDWRDDILAENPDADEHTIFATAYEINGDYLDDEKANLNVTVDAPIIMILDLDLWNGHRYGYKLMGQNIADCLDCYTCGDYVTFYVDEDGEFKCDDSHHDGTNCYTFRKVKADAPDSFNYAVVDGEATKEDMLAYTEPLGGEIAKVYGWEG